MLNIKQKQAEETMFRCYEGNGIELNFIKSLLEENNIPYILKDIGSGAYMRIYSGFSIYWTDILIEASRFDKAKEIMDEFFSSDND